MKTFICWLSPSPGYEDHGELYPISTTLFFITSSFGRPAPKGELLNAEALTLTEQAVDILLRHDAEYWSWKKTGDDRRPEWFDQAHAGKLFTAYKKKLAETGELDFTIPCAGVNV